MAGDGGVIVGRLVEGAGLGNGVLKIGSLPELITTKSCRVGVISVVMHRETAFSPCSVAARGYHQWTGAESPGQS